VKRGIKEGGGLPKLGSANTARVVMGEEQKNGDEDCSRAVENSMSRKEGICAAIHERNQGTGILGDRNLRLDPTQGMNKTNNLEQEQEVNTAAEKREEEHGLVFNPPHSRGMKVDGSIASPFCGKWCWISWQFGADYDLQGWPRNSGSGGDRQVKQLIPHC
jgi:hypothetical protein